MTWIRIVSSDKGTSKWSYIKLSNFLYFSCFRTNVKTLRPFLISILHRIPAKLWFDQCRLKLQSFRKQNFNVSLWLQFSNSTFNVVTSDYVVCLFLSLAKGGNVGTGKISGSEGGWGHDLKGSNQFYYEIY